jgi:hypothetical protein
MLPLSRLPLGDQAWFLFHEQYRRGTLVDETVFNLVLGAALIAELWFDRHIDITEDGRLAPSPDSPLAWVAPPGRRHLPRMQVTTFEENAWTAINSRPAYYPLNDWINYWAAHGPDEVQARMVAAGLLQKARRNTFVPTDPHVAAGPSVRQRYIIENGFHKWREGEDVRQYYETALLAGFSLATNFDLVVARDSGVLAQDEFRSRLQYMVMSLPTKLQVLLGEVGRAFSVQGRRPSRRP